MSEGGTWIEIVLLAMLAGFIGLRLVSVLGRRTGHERPIGEPFRPGQAEVSAPAGTVIDAPARVALEFPAETPAETRTALQAIAAADPRFDPARFLGGARAAYKMILEAFWAGDAAAMDGLVSDEVLLQFKRAIAARAEAGTVYSNRLAGIDGATISAARMVGQMAEVTVRFDARIAGDDAGEATPTQDVWTFSRHVGSVDPNWLLIATDDEA